ncbi:MAG: hypothetical protein KJP00_03295 [Bacteroidia bacterium]|nr:hypothetical protein [Bacteroidia bacterium]
MKNLFLLFAFGLLVGSLSAQSGAPAKIKIFLDCQTRGCDRQYFRQEMQYADFMRDRQEADIFLQLVSQRSANGGRQYSLKVIDQKTNIGEESTLLFFVNPEDSDGVVRSAILNNIEKGLLPYLLKTQWADNITFQVEVPEDLEVTSIEADDPWNAWVFRINANGNVGGEEAFKRFDFSGRVSASRIIEASKFFISIRYSENRRKFDLGDDGIIQNRNNSSNIFLLYAKSIGDHWSIGGFASHETSDFSNISEGISIKPAVEYSVFPYAEATTKQFTFLYRIGPIRNQYIEETTFGLTEETVIQQNLNIEYNIIKDWGNFGLEFSYNNYIRDLEQMSISFGPELEWNIFKGFSIDLSFNASYIADRINISKGDLSEEEILLGIRQLDSNFSYRGFFGVSYRFGSDVNNVVNPRFF